MAIACRKVIIMTNTTGPESLIIYHRCLKLKRFLPEIEWDPFLYVKMKLHSHFCNGALDLSKEIEF